MSINTMAREAVANTGATPQPPSKDTILAGLTKHIPTESITLYVATVSSQAALSAFGLTPHIAYWGFVAITPGLLLILFLRQYAVAGENWKVPMTRWPWWKMIASTIAFGVWAMAVPGNPIVDSNNAAAGVVAGFAALLVSTLLNLFTPFFEK